MFYVRGFYLKLPFRAIHIRLQIHVARNVTLSSKVPFPYASGSTFRQRTPTSAFSHRILKNGAPKATKPVRLGRTVPKGPLQRSLETLTRPSTRLIAPRVSIGLGCLMGLGRLLIGRSLHELLTTWSKRWDQQFSLQVKGSSSGTRPFGILHTLEDPEGAIGRLPARFKLLGLGLFASQTSEEPGLFRPSNVQALYGALEPKVYPT